MTGAPPPRPLPSSELVAKIRSVCGGDHSAAAFTQETIIYLAMFIRAEPELFQVGGVT